MTFRKAIGGAMLSIVGLGFFSAVSAVVGGLNAVLIISVSITITAFIASAVALVVD